MSNMVTVAPPPLQAESQIECVLQCHRSSFQIHALRQEPSFEDSSPLVIMTGRHWAHHPACVSLYELLLGNVSIFKWGFFFLSVGIHYSVTLHQLRLHKHNVKDEISLHQTVPTHCMPLSSSEDCVCLCVCVHAVICIPTVQSCVCGSIGSAPYTLCCNLFPHCTIKLLFQQHSPFWSKIFFTLYSVQLLKTIPASFESSRVMHTKKILYPSSYSSCLPQLSVSIRAVGYTCESLLYDIGLKDLSLSSTFCYRGIGVGGFKKAPIPVSPG